jgi:hypothetical protein
MQKIYVQNKDGEALMPTERCGAVRRWLRDGKAKVVQLMPFTIRLNWNCESNTQEVVVGIDTGAVNVGCSAVSNDKVLYASETKLRTDISKKMQKRAMYRAARRSRKTRHREPRFDNRTRPEGWLPPSLKSKAEATTRIVQQLSGILPITKVVVEIAKFDTQKLQNPDIEGVGYQNGQTAGYDNLRAYVFERDNYTCQTCKKKLGILEVHHIIQRKDGGSDRPDNLATVHTVCHEKFHKGEIRHKFSKPKQYRAETQVTILKNFIINELKKDFNVEVTFGYITKRSRQRLELEKNHVNDAIAICNPLEIDAPRVILKQVCVPRGRYQLTKGKRSEKRLPGGKVFGFSQFDKVRLPNGSIGFVKGRRSSGFFDICNVDNNPISHSIKHTKLTRLHSNNGLMEVKIGNSSPTKPLGLEGVSLPSFR